MEVNGTGRKMEQKELEEMAAILTKLWMEGLLTDIDCRLIASCNKLMEKRGAVYTVIMSKSKQDAANLTEIFRNLTVAIHSKEKSITLHDSNSSEEINHSVLPSQNPFLNNTIIKHLFGFLPLKTLKISRLVCREWNSTAEICLQKRYTMHFRQSGLLPNTFIAYSKYSQLDLPFPSFAFSGDKNFSWNITDIQDFLKKWENNIKALTFNTITLVQKCSLTNEEVLIPNYDITDIFTNPVNITSLKIKNPYLYAPKTKLNISLQKFVSIKTLFLTESGIIVSAENQSAQIAPLNMYFENVRCIKNGEDQSNFYYHDLVDFSKALNIFLEGDFDDVGSYMGGIFDMGKQVFNLDQLHLYALRLENWAHAKGEVNSLCLYNIPFVKKNQLKIKKLGILNSNVDLNTLPQTLESFYFLGLQAVEVVCNEALDLPDLKHLSLHIRESNSLVYFSNCPNLIALEILEISASGTPIPHFYTFNLGCVPKTVKMMTINCFQMEGFVNENCIFELETLILKVRDEDSDLTNCTAFTSKIKAKILVIDCGKKLEVDTSAFLNLIRANPQAIKILIGSFSDLHKKIPFEGSDLSKLVDKKSNYYQFENTVGKSITEEEFKKYFKMNNFFPPDFFVGE